MKIFQIEDGFCHWDATAQFPTLESLDGHFPPELIFVEAPDYVREGWGYMDEKFIKPEAPVGWVYEEETGTFKEGGSDCCIAYSEKELAEQRMTDMELALFECNQLITDLELSILEGRN